MRTIRINYMGNHGKRIKMTNKLEDKLFKVSVDTINEFFEENKEEMINDEYAFSKKKTIQYSQKKRCLLLG